MFHCQALQLKLLPRLSWAVRFRCLGVLHVQSRRANEGCACSLASCFAELPTLQGISYAAESNSPGNASRTTAVSEASPACALLALPRDVLRLMMRGMAPPDVRALGGTCRPLCDVARDATPGLLLDLFPHQVSGYEPHILHACVLHAFEDHEAAM